MSVHKDSYVMPTCRRLVWISFSRFITFFIPNVLLLHLGGMTTSASRQAWREKVALLVLYLLAATFLCFWLEFISSLFCDPEKTYDYNQVFNNGSKLTAINGKAVDWHHYTGNPVADYVNKHPHKDLSANFPTFIALNRSSPTAAYNDEILNDCIYSQNKGMEADAWLRYLLQTDPGYRLENNVLTYCPLPSKLNVTGAPCFYGNEVNNLISSMPMKGDIRYEPSEISKIYNELPSAGNMTKKGYVILGGYVLDVTTYLNTVTNIIPLSPTLSSRSFALDRMFLPLDLTMFLYINLGKDITDYFNGNMTTIDNPELYQKCLIHLFQKGVVPSYTASGCARINPALWATMGVGLLYFLVKMNLAYLSRLSFIQRYIFSSKMPPESSTGWPYTILMVPCFAESSDTLKQTLDTLSRSAYEDSKKLLLFVCDGIVEEKATHTVLLSHLGYSCTEDPLPHSYVSLGLGSRKVNYARVHSGYYETGRNRVPYLVVVKIGTQRERRVQGNRGKRDSLVLVLGFLERCMNLATNRITPLDYEMFNQCYNVLGIDPRLFKYLLVTDADIQVTSDAVQKLVSRLEANTRLLAISGHVRPANPEQNLTTMLQLFPVYTQFFSGLAYEACLKSVMTIQGGLVMYKIFTEECQNDLYFKKYQQLNLYQQTTRWPKMSDEIIITNPFTRRSSSSDNSTTVAPAKIRPGSRLSLSARRDIKPCCVHPTVLRSLATPQPNTMHMQSVLLLGEEKLMPIALLKAHPGYRLAFEPDAVGYATLPTNYFAMQGLQTRNLRAAFHVQLEMQRVAWQLGFTYWLLSTAEILDMIFSMPIIVYLYGIFGRSVKQYGMAYLIIACSFTGLVALHILFFLLRRQFRYIVWFVLYCLFSLPLFAIWFPLLAVWQSDDAHEWYDVWPISSQKWYQKRSRSHGILPEPDMEEKQDEEEEQVPRMRLGEYEVVEAKRLHEAAEAALDSNFKGFAAATTRASSEEVSPPPLAQVRDGVHATRIMTNDMRRAKQPDSPNPFMDPVNPFDDDYQISPSAPKHHKPSHSQSSYFTYVSSTAPVPLEADTLTSSLNSSGFAKLPPPVTPEDNPFDRASTTLSIASNTFSLFRQEEEEISESPRHQRFLNVSQHTPRPQNEGRSIALHNFASRQEQRLAKPSSMSLAVDDPLTSVSSEAIKQEIRQFLMRSDLELTTRAQVKQHLTSMFGVKVVEEQDTQWLVECIEEITFELLC